MSCTVNLVEKVVLLARLVPVAFASVRKTKAKEDMFSRMSVLFECEHIPTNNNTNTVFCGISTTLCG